MASASEISNALAKAMLDNAVNSLLNEGAGYGIVNIYSGSLPSNCEANDTGTLLATCMLSSLPFGAATDTLPGARITANIIADDPSAVVGGTASHYRAFSSDDGTNANRLNCHIQGSAGEAADSTDLTLDVKLIVLGASVSITSWTISMPES